MSVGVGRGRLTMSREIWYSMCFLHISKVQFFGGGNMAIGMGDLVSALLLVCIGALAWRRRRNVGGKTWALRVVPFGLLVVHCFGTGLLLSIGTLGVTLAAYAVVAYRGG